MRMQEQGTTVEKQRIDHEWQTVQSEVKRLLDLNIPYVLSTLANELEEKGTTATTGIEIETPHSSDIGLRVKEDKSLAASSVYPSHITRVSLLLKTAPHFTLTHIHSPQSERQELDAYVVTAYPGGIECSKQRRVRIVGKEKQQREVAIQIHRGPKLEKDDYNNPSVLRQKLLDFFRT